SLNQRRRQGDFALFEIGTVFHPREAYAESIAAASASVSAAEARKDKSMTADEAIREEQQLAVALGGRLGVNWRSSGKGRPVDFYDLRGLAESVLEALCIKKWKIVPESDVAWLHPGRAAR